MTSYLPDTPLAPVAARNKARYLQAKEAFNRGDLAACLACYAPDHQIRSRLGPPGRAAIEAFFAQSRQAWPDIHLAVEHVLAEGDWVMGRSVATATHTTAALGVPPTGKAVRTTFWDLHRFDAGGLIAETWNLLDAATLTGEIGLLPVSK